MFYTCDTYEKTLIFNIAIITGWFVPYTYVYSFFFSDLDVDGSPAYTWVSTVPVHLSLLPTIAALAYTTHPYPTTSEWLFSETDVVFRLYEQLWLSVFIAHMLKDFVISQMTMLYIFHHLASIGSAFVFLFGKQQPAIFCVGCTIMEIGSATHTLAVLYPGSYRIRMLYKHGMTFANTVCLMMLVFYTENNLNNPLRLFMVAIGAMFCILRQQYTIQYMKHFE